MTAPGAGVAADPAEGKGGQQEGVSPAHEHDLAGQREVDSVGVESVSDGEPALHGQQTQREDGQLAGEHCHEARHLTPAACVTMTKRMKERYTNTKLKLIIPNCTYGVLEGLLFWLIESDTNKNWGYILSIAFKTHLKFA